MLELLVAATCLSGDYECNTALKAYYSSRPLIRHQVKRVRNKAAELTGPYILYAVPAISAVYKGKYQFKITRNISCTIEQNQGMLVFSKSF